MTMRLRPSSGAGLVLVPGAATRYRNIVNRVNSELRRLGVPGSTRSPGEPETPQHVIGVDQRYPLGIP